MTGTPGPAAPGAADALAALEAAARILADSRSILVIDWPSRDVPASLAFAGYTVFVKGGPGPGDYNTWARSGSPSGQAAGVFADGGSLKALCTTCGWLVQNSSLPVHNRRKTVDVNGELSLLRGRYLEER